MKKIDQLVVPDHIKRGIEAGEGSGGDSAYNANSRSSSKAKFSKDHVDVINQMFAEFELAYHNQYHKAFPDEGTLNLAKKYWLTSLAAFLPELVLAATRELVHKQPFLPTIANVVDSCKSGVALFGLPSAHDAYLEACRMPAPKAVQNWSHSAVYMAGKATGWFELANQAEGKIFPLFEYHYAQLVQRVLHGEELTVNIPTPLPETVDIPLSAKENQSHLQALKDSLKIV
ncbi:hypothetical protein JYT97_00975 [Haliea sp. AH-315-K21]|uniref:Uncharacterized protein n=1 Tax=SAR86 cluster bacterium TaxID=2030880 RepID=A0A2A5CD70_9GAMM|nr:hypothetical protein [Haliea sp. AH-315-K21]MBN4075511.1 hypothetical protein [Gammaproteobacteria bacterium AH-315-E17]PCJ41817.1 MAG: hypothetical protein COA71_07345 [SAR86 cluster bacterium]PCJ43806.1 MAG: hypothetical protein COA71_02775 [SAR86 cluster bacterium]